MPSNTYQIGAIKIHLPDENQGYFSIFEDLAEIFDTEYQSEAVKLLKAKLKDIKPKASIDYESDFTSIRTSSVDTLVAVIDAIVDLKKIEGYEYLEIDQPALKSQFERAKKHRPKPKEWKTGDVFSIPLLDGTFSFGQVLDQKYCTCALFDIKSKLPELSPKKFSELRPLSILHLSNGNLLNNGQWAVVFNEQIKLDPGSGHGGKFGAVGCISYGQCGKMTDLANCYWGLEPWNVMYEEDYYDKMLFKGVSRPKLAVILNQSDRSKYRKEKFGI